MSVKATGAEFKAFYTDDKFWPQDQGETYHDDESVTVDGQNWDDYFENIPDASKVVIEGGVVFSSSWESDDAPSFEAYFKRWRKQQSTVYLVVDVPKDKLDAVKVAIKAAGGLVK